MYNPGGGYGYPPNAGGYPPNAGGYPGQQPPGGQPMPGIGFDNLAGGGPPAAGGYGYPPSQSPYPSGAGGYAGTGPQAAAPYPSGGAPYPGGGAAYPPSGGAPSFAGAAYATTAAMNFYPSQPSYPQQQQQPQPYGNPHQQNPSFAGAAYATSAAMNFQQQRGYPQQQQQQPSQPYGGAPQQQSYPTNQTASYQQPYGNHQSAPTQQINQLHLASTSSTPKRPPPPSSSSSPSRPQIPKEPATQGTVKDAYNFDAQADSEVLRKAMKGMGTDEKAITAVLGCRSNKQRLKIKLQFATMFGKDLMNELKSELSGNYEIAALALLMEPAEYDAFQCNNSISGVGTDEKCLIEILCSRSNTEILALREAYKKLYKRELEKDLMDDTSGYFKRLLVSLVQGGRDENQPLDHQKAAEDAHALYQAGEAKWGTDESRFNVILASRSIPQLRLVFNEYEKISKKKSLEKAIISEMSGDLKDGMLSVVKCARNKAAFFAERLYWSMKGLGTDDRTLVRIMVSRCEVDMVQIKHEFQRAYGKTLDSFIQDDCSGDYKKILLQLCTGN